MPFQFFSRKTTPLQASLPAYDPDLIMTLQGEHALLLDLLQQVRRAAKDGRYTEVGAALQRFESAYQQHQGRKERQLLPYLELHVQHEESKTALRTLTGSGALTQRSVLGFLKHYQTTPVSDHNLRRFGRELDGVIAELSQRLDMESGSLHGLYVSARPN